MNKQIYIILEISFWFYSLKVCVTIFGYLRLQEPCRGASQCSLVGLYSRHIDIISVPSGDWRKLVQIVWGKMGKRVTNRVGATVLFTDFPEENCRRRIITDGVLFLDSFSTGFTSSSLRPSGWIALLNRLKLRAQRGQFNGAFVRLPS